MAGAGTIPPALPLREKKFDTVPKTPLVADLILPSMFVEVKVPYTVRLVPLPLLFAIALVAIPLPLFERTKGIPTLFQKSATLAGDI